MTNLDAKIGAEALTQLLQAEIDRYDAAIRSELKQVDRVLLSSFSVAGIAAPILLNYHQYAVLLAIPIVGYLGFFLAMNASSDMFALAARKFHAESNLAAVLQRALPASHAAATFMPWDLGGGYLRRRSVSYIALQGMYICAFALASLASLVIAWVQVPYFRWICVLVAVAACLLLVPAALSFREVTHIYAKTLARIRDHQPTAEPPAADTPATGGSIRSSLGEPSSDRHILPR